MAMKRVKKRKPKKALIVLIIIFALVLVGVGSYFLFFQQDKVTEAKVVSKIPAYGYTLKNNKSNAYKKLFQELKDVLDHKNVNEEDYVRTISKMFIVDFFSLGDHIAKTDVGGVDFVHPDILDNFLINAEDTIYRYVESDIYKQRKQSLPIVDEVKVNDIETKSFTYQDTTDEDALYVQVSWTYQDTKIAKDYQNEATLVYVHDGKKLVLVELLNDLEEDEEEEE